MLSNVLIVGGVATGPKTAARLRRLDPEVNITVIDRQDLLSYAGCGMPYYIEDIIKDYNDLLGGATIRNAEYFNENKGFKVLDQTEAKKINRGEKTLLIEDLRTNESRKLSYDKLVLATGASPFVPKIDGTELNGVHRLYNPHHADAIKSALDIGCSKVVVVGAGLIGMETCGAFVARGCDTTVIEMMINIAPNLFDEEIAQLLENYLRSNGVTIVKGSPATKIIDDGFGNTAGVQTADNRMFEADMVLLAIGVRPNTELAVDAGLDIGSTDAIAVNEYLQTSDPDIYAGGDCVECTNILTGEKVFAPLGSTANKHGRVIADNITGKNVRFPGVSCTVVFKVLNWNCGTTGITEKKATEMGYDVVTSITPRYDFSSYIPGAKYTIIKLIAERGSGKVIGCQVVGEGDGVKRIDVIATAIKFGSNLKEIADLDLGYAPAYSTAIDAIAHAANVLRNKIHDIAHGISPIELKTKLESDENFVLLDVRRPEEFENWRLNDKRIMNIPLNEIKTRYNELPKDNEVITYCVTSVRAYNAERILRGYGFKKVRYLDGSLVGWPYLNYLT
jgi:NADPH-dependent 2,4-dienoyl-CoA reductase/sulfur reductase-like enzyme/rhodanese-related sulfurtransferase